MANKAKPRKSKAVTKAAIPNQDPYFFLPTPCGTNVSAQEIGDKPYQYHPWVNASARTICFNVARLPHVLVDPKQPDELIIEHEALELLKNPNPYMTEMSLWKAIILGLLLPDSSPDGKSCTGGQVFLIPLDKMGNHMDLTQGGIPATLLPYTDRYFRASTHKKLMKNGAPHGWHYEVPGKPETKQEFGFTEVIRINFFNPYDWRKGMSFYTPAQLAVLQDIKSDVFNTAFFDNDARVSGILSTEQPMTDDQHKTLLKRWYEQYGGPGNAQKMAVLALGMKYEQMASSHADMQYQEQKSWIKDQVISVFGLNKIALGDYESINFATIREGRRALWQDTYQPIDRIIWDALNDQWLKYVDGGKYKGKSDYTAVEALRPDLGKQAEAAGVMVDKLSFTPALAAQMSGLPLTKEHIKMYPWLDEKPEKPAPIALPGSGDDEDEEDPKKPPKKPPKEEDEDKKARRKREADTKAEARTKRSWDYIHKVLDPGEKRFLKQMERFVTSQRNRMQDIVDKWLKQNPEKTVKDVPIVGRVPQITVEYFMLNIIKENKSLIALWKPLVEEQMLAEEAQLTEELGSLIEWNVTDERVDAFIAQRKDQIKGINSTTFKVAREKIGNAIEVAIKDNASPGQTAKLVKDALGDMGEVRKNQSKTIARTETGTISSQARFDALKNEGFEYVEWLTAGDEAVRNEAGMDHVAAGASGPIKLGTPFPGVGSMRYPLDPRGAAGSIVNCRCALIASEKPV